MKSPRFPPSHPNYGSDLEAEIEPFLTETVDRVVDAGWCRDATWTAIISLVADLERTTLETSETDNMIEEVVSLLDNFR